MKNLLTPGYWFNLRPEPLLPNAQKILLGILLGWLIFTVVTALWKRRSGIYRGLWQSLYALSLTNLLIGLILWFFNYEAVPFFSARFWLGLWLIAALAWLIFVLRKLKVISRRRKKLVAEEALKKYLP